MENRPQGRQKNVTGHGKGLNRRGSGMGNGPVGSGSGSGGGFNRRSYGSGGGQRSGGGGGGMMKIIILLLVALMGGGAGMGGLLGGESTDSQPAYTPQPSYSQTAPAPSQSSDPFGFFGTPSSGSSSGGHNVGQGFDYSSIFGGGSGSASGSSSGWLNGSNTGRLNSSVDASARKKYTKILGNNQDTVTVMVYMCGTDLESRSGMGSKDLQEMLNATVTGNVNLLVYTGGCSRWRNNVISSSVNQIYQIKDGSMKCLVKDAGTGSMVSPKTLTSFIQYATKNFPANRNMLILWDHGGGSISGYGYDEKARNAGAMSLGGLDEALKNAKTKFDFIGYDACLMGSLETGLTMAPYADYLIASEETEPGLGWYYTNWLTTLSRNTSTPTLEVGKQIVDDFVNACAQSCPGQKTTLSVVDLSELEKTVPADFKAFSQSTLQLLKDDGYQTVARARSSVREFAASTKVDQIDLVHLALKLDTEESRELAQSALSAIKYNRTSSDMTNAYGLSLYFPYQKVSGVNNAVVAYNAIGLDDDYTDCIRTFASLEMGGQAAAGGHTSPMTTLNGGSYSGQAIGSDMLTQMLEQLLGGNTGAYGISGSSGFFDRSLDLDSTAAYLAQNRFDTDALVWQYVGGEPALHLSEQQWSLVQDLELNVFADDGEGYIDLGLDTTFEFTPSGDLVGSYDGTWLAIDSQNVAFYHVETTSDESGYSITGRVPVLLNGVRSDLILVFDSENPYGYIAGARTDYHDGETETVAKGITELEPGDVIDFLCDYYSYDGTYLDSYMLGEQHIYTGNELISNVYIDADAVAAYRLTDIYGNQFWTPVIP